MFPQSMPQRPVGRNKHGPLWEIGCSLAKVNRDRLRKQWQQEKQSRTPPAGRSNS